MLMTFDDSEGMSLYCLRGALTRASHSRRLYFKATTAKVGAPQTEAYVAFIARQLESSAGRFLFGFNGQDLEEREARIVTAYSASSFAPETLVAARHYAVDDEGALWLRGMCVETSLRGRRIGPALAAISFADALRHQRAFQGVRAAVIVADDIPNENSVKALQKLGFELTNEGGEVALEGSHRDRHLLAHATLSDGRAVINYRKLWLPKARVPSAVGFLSRWIG